MGRFIGWLFIATAVAAALGAAALWLRRGEPAPRPLIEELRPLNPPVAPGAMGAGDPRGKTPWLSGEPATVQYPLSPAADAIVLPTLADSDGLAQETLAGLVGRTAVATLFEPRDVVRRLVIMVDNLPAAGGKLPAASRLLKPVAGAFATAGDEEEPILDEVNYGRYAGLVELAERVDIQAAVAAYRRLYPLFQQAYVELGYPNRYFNDRLVEVIDHLLASTDVPGPVHLTQPRVLFEFADPQLQGLSPGHKIMIRIGPRNAARLKVRLEALRSAIVAAGIERT